MTKYLKVSNSTLKRLLTKEVGYKFKVNGVTHEIAEVLPLVGEVTLSCGTMCTVYDKLYGEYIN